MLVILNRGWMAGLWALVAGLFLGLGGGCVDLDMGASASGTANIDESARRLLGKPAPPLKAAMLDGRVFDVKEATGTADEPGGVLVLDFWATWCPPCRLSLPEAKEMVDGLVAEGHDVRLVAVNMDEGPAVIRSFLSEMGLEDVEVALNYDSDAAWVGYAAKGLPQAVVIDRTGRVSAIHQGYSPELKSALRADVLAALEG